VSSIYNMDEALEIVDAYINKRYKSIYLMSAWMKIREYIHEHEKGETNEKPSVH